MSQSGKHVLMASEIESHNTYNEIWQKSQALTLLRVENAKPWDPEISQMEYQKTIEQKIPQSNEHDINLDSNY